MHIKDLSVRKVFGKISSFIQYLKLNEIKKIHYKIG